MSGQANKNLGDFMNQLNSLILEGNATRLPEMRETPHGFKVCRIPLAVNRFYKNSDGQGVKEVSFFDVEAFGKLAEFSEQNVEVGRGVRIVGRLKQGRWKNAEGKSMSRVSIIAEHIEFKPRVKKDIDASQEEASIVSEALESDSLTSEDAVLQEEEIAF